MKTLANVAASFLFVTTLSCDNNERERTQLPGLSSQNVHQTIDATTDFENNETRIIARFNELSKDGKLLELRANESVKIDGLAMGFSEDDALCGADACYFLSQANAQTDKPFAYEYFASSGETYRTEIKLNPAIILTLAGCEIAKASDFKFEWPATTHEEREEFRIEFRQGSSTHVVKVGADAIRRGNVTLSPADLAPLSNGEARTVLIRELTTSLGDEGASLAGGTLTRRTVSKAIICQIK